MEEKCVAYERIDRLVAERVSQNPIDGGLVLGAHLPRGRPQLAGDPAQKPHELSPRAGQLQQLVDLRRARRRTTSCWSCPARRLSRSELHTSELQSSCNVVCRLLLEEK